MTADQPTPIWRRGLGAVVGQFVVFLARLVIGVRGNWHGSVPTVAQTLYFANHNSHGDFVLIWTTLPPHLRRRTRPVAGQDYWLASGVRRFIGSDVFNALMIRRDHHLGGPDPIQQMVDALGTGHSLIMFPEGTRNTGDAVMLPLKSGLYHVAERCPEVRLVPVWLDNLWRVLPKGAVLPVPLACTVTYGKPIALQPGEDKEHFLQRARQAMLDLRPDYDDRTDVVTAAPEQA